MEVKEEYIHSDNPMKKYHKYLTDNYVGGSERFFSPTGFLEKFQKTVEVKAQALRSHVFVQNVDEATQRLEAAINTGLDVFDLTAEPGTGKTSVLPFRFPSKRVIVALPTPFDAWNAYNMATGVANLKIKGLTLGPLETKVTYTDSYYAAMALMSNFVNFDILIVDECDSDRGVTRFLSEVKVKGKLLIRMSATHGRTQAGISRAFAVTEAASMPDIRDGVGPLASYIKEKHTGRSLVLTPDSASAKDLATKVEDSVLLTVDTRLDIIAKHVKDQSGNKLYVSDDTCGRALNLNLDMVFDTQLVTEYSNVRLLTAAELQQRKGRVGRNRSGWYHSPGLSTMEKKQNDFDIVRHNVARAIAHVPQFGDDRLHVTQEEVNELMCSPVEPYGLRLSRIADTAAVVSSSSSSGSSDEGVSQKKLSRGRKNVLTDEGALGTVQPPGWLAYYVQSDKASDKGKKAIVDTFVVANARGHKAFVRRTSGSSADSMSDAVTLRSSGGRRSDFVRTHNMPVLPVVTSAPYAVDRSLTSYKHEPLNIPSSPPVMDLSANTYDIDWPALIRDRLSTGGDLPTLVPPCSWRHTSMVGLGTDWLVRLDAMAQADMRFNDQEFEVVCRAWNRLVGQAWVKRSPGLNNVSDAYRIEYCVRYFQAYFLLGSVG